MDEKLVAALDHLKSIMSHRQSNSTDCLECIRKWSEISGDTMQDCLKSIITMKLARIECCYEAYDSLIDIAGYAMLWSVLEANE
jgi:hypothetical protein